MKGIEIKAIEACNGDISYFAHIYWTILTHRKIDNYDSWMLILTINTSNHIECEFNAQQTSLSYVKVHISY